MDAELNTNFTRSPRGLKAGNLGAHSRPHPIDCSRRYAIVDERMLGEGANKLAAYQSAGEEFPKGIRRGSAEANGTLAPIEFWQVRLTEVGAPSRSLGRVRMGSSSGNAAALDIFQVPRHQSQARASVVRGQQRIDNRQSLARDEAAPNLRDSFVHRQHTLAEKAEHLFEPFFESGGLSRIS